MKMAYKRRIVLLLVMITCILAFVCGCKMLILDRSESTDATGSAETAEMTTPTPTKKPLPTPTPTPASIYIPREELPDGQLFEEGYYAVLPGEGAYYNVFDCYGKQIDSFLFTNGESSPPIGVYTEKTLSQYCRLNFAEVQDIIPTDDYIHFLQSNENGFYQMSYSENDEKVILYNTEGDCIRTLTSPASTEGASVDIVVRCLDDETVVSLSSQSWNDENSNYSNSIIIYFVALDGTINDKCEANQLSNRPIGLVGREYFLVYSDAGDSEICDMVDFYGNIVMEDVDVLPESTFRLWSDEAATNIKISDYYSKDGSLYDSSFQPLQKNQLGTEGELIYGNAYDVEGIPCTATYWKHEQGFYADDFFAYSGDTDLIAVGSQGDQIAIKTKDAEYVFDGNGHEFYGMNDNVLVLTGKTIISLKTGKVLQTVASQNEVLIADEYIVACTGQYDPYTGRTLGGYIIDKDGNIRYMAEETSIKRTLGEYIVLYRGPYVGIADLNGEWVMKTLAWELTRDAVYSNPFE